MIQGIFETDIGFALARFHIGKKDNHEFVQISFPALGDMNNDTTDVVIVDTKLEFVFIINDLPCYFHLEMTEGNLSGTMDLPSVNMHQEFVAQQISEESGFREHYYTVPENNVQALREHNQYTKEHVEAVFDYELNNPEVLEFVRRKGIDVENHHDFETIQKLMQKVSEIIHHDGVHYTHDQIHRGTIAQFCHAEQQGCYTNCRGIAIILAGVLRAYGFKAAYVECWPQKSENMDIHVVCEVFVPDCNKTVLLDPSSNLIYFINEKPLSLMELREAIVFGQESKISFNSGAAQNSEEFNLIQMIAFMSKNLFHLRKTIHSNEIQEINSENSICLSSRDLMQELPTASTRDTSNIQEFYA